MFEAIGRAIQAEPGLMAGVVLMALAVVWIILKRLAIRRAEAARQEPETVSPDDMPDLEPSLRKARIKIVICGTLIVAFLFSFLLSFFIDQYGTIN